jgi:O-methyltransferase domain
MSASTPTQLVNDLAKAHIAARCLHIVAETGVADALDETGASAAQLAAATGLDPGALQRLLRLLAAHGVFAETPLGFEHNDASRLLRSDHPQSLRAYVRMTGMPAFWNGFGNLAAAARAGRPASDWRGLVAYFEDHPQEAAVFNAAMTAKSAVAVPAVLAAYDFGTFARIADIGGGRGHLLRAILDKIPTAHGVLFDLAHVIADAGTATPRLELMTGDFFSDPLPSADAYLLMDLLHDWDDSDADRIVRAIRNAALPGARLLVIETLAPETLGPHFGKTLDIIMLAVTGGRERRAPEFRTLLETAGFAMDRVIATASAYSILEAHAV